jgi:hypothetical protein
MTPTPACLLATPSKSSLTALLQSLDAESYFLRHTVTVPHEGGEDQ